MTSSEFRKMFSVLHNMNRWELENLGLIPTGSSGDDKWVRFNKNLTTFVLKLSDKSTEKLMNYVLSKATER